MVGIIELLERYLVDFDRLAAVQRIVPVEKEKIVEKEVTKPIVVPTRDSESIRAELANSLLIEKLVVQLQGLLKKYPNEKLNLDNDVGLIFFSEFNGNTTNKPAGIFQENLSKYTTQAMSKLSRLGSNWSDDH